MVCIPNDSTKDIRESTSFFKADIAILVDKDNYLLELCRYVVLNPVRAKMVKTPKTGDGVVIRQLPAIKGFPV